MRGYGCYEPHPDAAFRAHAKIIVKQYRTLNIYTKSHFYACGDMWDGIEAENGSFVRVTGNSIIEDAEIALDIFDGAFYSIDQANFNKNHMHVRLKQFSGTPTYPVYRIRRSKFLCQNSTSDPTHATLLPQPLHRWHCDRLLPAQYCENSRDDIP